MFDIGATELLLIIVVAVIVIGPKDLPMALRTAGRWIGKMRRLSGHFRSGLDAMVREAELADMQKEWDKRNADIMAKHPATDPETGKLADASAEVAAPAAQVTETTPVAPAASSEPVATEPAAKPAAKPVSDAQTLPLFDDGATGDTSKG
ncbi:Sec-independent protein translocase protein TatB [Croceicoccus bisphenolivorans]|uniref:Sec-independent protein translocase protein TatB n=1 Tax=Croceicoccus bisphenolivorans TaxID=1783232 RepID=UPI000830F10B|nr:Sec-independent protein translocase protein TatB [Croceicoccus bisphenolivorans]